MNTRALAANIITDVFVQGQSLTDALEERHSLLSNKRDAALLQELSYGVTRWWWRYDAILKKLLDKPLKSKDSDLKHLAMVGLHQLIDMRVPDHAAIAETVSACDDLKRPWAKKLTNALLRNYQRDNKAITATLADDPAFLHSHPQWLQEKFRKAWPDDWQRIIEANNQKPPMVLRVNSRKITRQEYCRSLQEKGIKASEFKYCEQGLVLEEAVPVEQLPGFEQGQVSVQDGAAQLAAGLMDLAGCQNVLDVCAAPGGKTAHILESVSEHVSVTALDLDAGRLQKVAETMTRLGLTAHLLVADAREPDKWWDQRKYDRILLDAPCSATGVIRRHPDIKQLRRPTDIPNLVTQQAHILRAVWPLLDSGGMLLYATCSILPEENEMQIKSFLDTQKDAKVVENGEVWGKKQAHGRQILPGQDGMDGFYYACLQKQ